MNLFYADPNPAVGTNSTTLNWSAADVTFITLTLPNGSNVNVTGTSSYTYNSLPSSNVESGNSPTTSSFTLTAGIPSKSVSLSLSVDARTDNNISGFGSWTTSWTGLDPLTSYDKVVGTISGIDVNVSVTSPDNVFFSKGSGWESTLSVSNGDTLYVRFFTLDYNTSLSGVNDGDQYGNTNTRTFSVNIGGNYSATWSAQTKAPRIRQDFDFVDSINAYPNPDIDFDPGSPNAYANSQAITFNDIDIDVPIKSNNENVQVKINSQDWQNVQEI